MSPDETHVITASLDKTARLIDVDTFEVMKTYKTGRFVQSAAISPLFDHVSAAGRRCAAEVYVGKRLRCRGSCLAVAARGRAGGESAGGVKRTG